jgi:asparagine synthase (glutamine-hydrolysing)
MKAARPAEAETCTFSVGFEDDSRSELPFAGTVARHLGTRHTEVAVRQGDYLSDLTLLTAVRDAPISEPADVAIARMSRVAAEQVKVVLSGEGADELFCGYPKYGFARASRALRMALRAVGVSGAERMARLVGLDSRRVGVAANSLTQASELDRLVQWFSYVDRTMLQGLFPGLSWSDEEWAETTGFQGRALDRFSGSDAVVRMQGLDLQTWLPGNLLERGDRMTMSAGLEARVPFLDKQVVAFGLALDANLKIRKRSLKWIVRQWARDAIPTEIIARRKQGFTVPLDSWFRGGMRALLRDTCTSRGGLCDRYGDRKQVQSLLDAHDSGTEDAHMELWTIFTAELWYQEVFQARDGSVVRRR